MALSLEEMDTLARDAAFRARVRMVLAMESEERVDTNPHASVTLMHFVQEDSLGLTAICYRIAFAFRQGASPPAPTDAQIRAAVSTLMARLYG